jgi:hypothetical protein
MLNIRPLPILLTICAAGLVLFGGWFAYNRYAVEEPLKQSIAEVAGVEASEPIITRESVTIDVALQDDAKLGDVYRMIREGGASVIGSRTLKLNIEQEESPELERVWSSVLFRVAEAMENRRYADIPTAMEALMAEREGLTAETSLDNENVYVTLKLDGAVKHIVLPRTPVQMGVWPNA